MQVINNEDLGKDSFILHLRAKDANFLRSIYFISLKIPSGNQ